MNLQKRIELETKFQGIKDHEIRLIARLRYVYNMSWQQIGDIMHMDRTTAARRLKEFETKK